MAHQPIKERSGSGLPLMSTTTLALWRVRRTWDMLVFAGLGMLAAVMLICAVPLYSRVATTAGLRGVLTSNRDASTVTVHMSTNDLPSNFVSQDTQQVNTDTQPAAPYLDGPPELMIPTQGISYYYAFSPGCYNSERIWRPVGEGISASDFYALQHLLPIRLAVPPSLAIALFVLIVICLVALVMMVRVVTRPEIGQLLRLNED